VPGCIPLSLAGLLAAFVGATGRETAAAVVVSATAADEAMFAPAVAVAPTSPGPHAEEDAVVEVSWAVKAHGSAAVGRVVIVAVGADGLNSDAYHDLSVGRSGECRHGSEGNERSRQQ